MSLEVGIHFILLTIVTIPETNSKFAPENGWLEYCTCFLLGRLGLFSGADLLLVSGSVNNQTE